MRELPDADLLVSGPPCTPFSAQGKRLHFLDFRLSGAGIQRCGEVDYHPRALAHRERARRAHCLLRVQPFRPPARLGASRPHVLRVFRLPEQIGSKFTSLVLPDRSCILQVEEFGLNILSAGCRPCLRFWALPAGLSSKASLRKRRRHSSRLVVSNDQSESDPRRARPGAARRGRAPGA